MQNGLDKELAQFAYREEFSHEEKPKLDDKYGAV
jgi:hypothetical protein